MLERLLLTLLLPLMAITIFLMIRHRHMRRASKAIVKRHITNSRPTLLYFRSDSCAPCITQAHYLQALESEFGSRVTIRNVDVDVDIDLATQYGIFTLPTTLVVDRSGEVRHINYGLTATQKLAKQLEKVE